MFCCFCKRFFSGGTGDVGEPDWFFLVLDFMIPFSSCSHVAGRFLAQVLIVELAPRMQLFSWRGQY